MNPASLLESLVGRRGAFIGFACLAISAAGHLPRAGIAADVIKANNTDSLGLDTSWTGGTAPTSDDVAVWNSTVTGANAALLGGDLSWQGIRIVNPGGAATISAGNTLTLGTAGIDMASATQNLSIASGLTVGATQAWSVASGRTLTVSGAVDGSGALTKSGVGTLSLTGSNSFSGGTSWGEGNISIANGSGLGTGTVTLTGTASRTLFVANSAAQTFAPAIVLPAGSNTTTITKTGPGDLHFTGTISGGGPNATFFPYSTIADSATTYTLSGTNTFRARIHVDRGSLIVNNVSGLGDPANPLRLWTYPDTTDGNLRFAVSGTFANPIENRAANFDNTIGTGENDVILSGQIFGLGGLRKYGAGRLTITSDTNTYGNGTQVAQGTLRVGDGGTTGVLGGGNVAVSAGATIAFDRSDTYGGAVSKVISGAGGLLASGGTLTLAGSNTYTGATAVAGGTLLVTGSIASSSLTTVQSGATLGGTGSVGATRILAGGVHSPGTSPGLQTFTNGLEYQAGATLSWELFGNTTAGRGTAYDGIDLTGGALAIDPGAILALDFGTLGNGSLVDWSDSFWGGDQTWTIVALSGSAAWNGDTFASLMVGPDIFGRSLASIRPDASFSVANVGGDLALTYAVVPEPGALLLAALGVAAAAWCGRRRIR